MGSIANRQLVLGCHDPFRGVRKTITTIDMSQEFIHDSATHGGRGKAAHLRPQVMAQSKVETWEET